MGKYCHHNSSNHSFPCHPWISESSFVTVNVILCAQSNLLIFSPIKNKIDLINTINALMISEMVVSPLLRYFDFFTILNRHIFAPRAKSEEELFGYFNGGWYNLAERFTDFTKGTIRLMHFWHNLTPKC